MTRRPTLAAALTGCYCLFFAAMPHMSSAADSTTSSAGLTTESKTATESTTAAVQASEPGTISNGYITYREEPTASFNHEVGGQFTLATPERGAIAQLFYGVTYDGKEAAYRHEEAAAPYPDGFDRKTTHSADSRRITTEVQSTDRAVAVRTESTGGKGPYVIRQMRVTNTSDKTLNKVRLLLTVNTDTLDWENEEGKVDAETAQVHVYNPDKTQWVGIAAQPKPAYLSVDSVTDLLGEESGSNWTQPSLSYSGNLAVQAGWELGPLEPGQSKTVEATLANTGNENDLRKALTRQEFPDL